MLKQLLLSAKLGDGCYIKQRVNASLSFNSVALNYLIHKKIILEKNGINTSHLSYGYSGYKLKKKIPRFYTKVDERLTEIYNMSKLECIQQLNKIGLIYLYLDDGSIHKRNGTGHIYCNSFSIEETETLINKIYELYPIKRASINYDRKKDGRCYPYVYIPKIVMIDFVKDVKNFLNKYDINDMLYKTVIPSTTIPKGSTLEV